MGGGVGIAVVVMAVGVGFGGEVAGALDADGGDPCRVFGEAADLALEEVENAEGDGEDADADEGPDCYLPDIPAAITGGGPAAVILRQGGRDGGKREQSERGEQRETGGELLHTEGKCTQLVGTEPLPAKGSKKGRWMCGADTASSATHVRFNTVSAAQQGASGRFCTRTEQNPGFGGL